MRRESKSQSGSSSMHTEDSASSTPSHAAGVLGGDAETRSLGEKAESSSLSSSLSSLWPFSSTAKSEVSVFDAIKNHDWDKARLVLNSSQGADLCKEIDDSTGISVLGLVVGFHAPMDIIQTVLGLAPEASLKEDQFGAIPLHIASLNGAPMEAIKALLDHDNQLTAVCVDEDLRAPLHHAVEFACRPHSDHEANEEKSPQHVDEDAGMDAVRLLCEAVPEMVTFSDRSGDTPIDIAQIVKFEAPDEDSEEYQRADRVYKLLRRVCTSVYWKQKREYEARGPCYRRHGRQCPYRAEKKDIPPVADLTLSTASLTIDTSPNDPCRIDELSSISG